MLIKNYHALAMKSLQLTLMRTALVLTAIGCSYPQPDASISTSNKYSITIMKAANRLASMPFKIRYQFLVNAHGYAYLRKMQMNGVKPSKELWKAEYKELDKINRIYADEVAAFSDQQPLIQRWSAPIMVAIEHKIEWLELQIVVGKLNKALKLATEAEMARKKGLASQDLERVSMVDFAKVMGTIKEHQSNTWAGIRQFRELSLETKHQDIDKERFDLIFSENRFYQIYLSEWNDEDLEALISSINSSWQNKLYDQ